MKDAAYVGVTTSVYREALDAALADPEGFAVRPEWSERLEQSFSRSFTTAHLQGRHDDVRSGGRGGHRGVLVGRVSGFDEATGLVRIKLSKPVAEGDVVYLYTPWGQTEPRRLEAGGDATITLRVRERVAVKDRLFRLAAADVGELGPRSGHRARGPAAHRAHDAPERGGGGACGAHGHRSDRGRAGHGVDGRAARRRKDGRAHRDARTRGARRARAPRPTGSPSSSSRSRERCSSRSATSRTCAGGPWRRSGSAAWPPAGAPPGAPRPVPQAPRPERTSPRPSGRRARAAPRRPRSSCVCVPARRRSRSRAAAPTAWTCSRVTLPRSSSALATRCARRARPCACACRRSSSMPTRPGWRTCSRRSGTPSSSATPACWPA